MQIRQEINILDHAFSSLSSTTQTSNELIYFDKTQFNGTVTAYFEVVAINNDSTNKNVTLAGGGGVQRTVTITAGTSAYTLFRSADFFSGAATSEKRIDIPATTSNGQLVVKSARIVIIQDTSTLTNTETQIEIGNYNLARTTETAAILTNPKYWKYDASKWDGTKTFYAEAVYDSGSMDTVSVYLYECTDILAPSWTLNATIVSAATTTGATRTRVAFTPVDGNWYTIFSLNGSMDDHDIYRAGIIVQQEVVPMQSQLTGNFNAICYGGTAGSGEADQQVGQSFTPDNDYTLYSISLGINRFGSPSDNIYLEIASTISGTALATSSNFPIPSVTSGYSWVNFDVGGISLTNGTKYYLRLIRTGARDTSNCPRWYQDAGDVYSGGGNFAKSNNVWSSEGTRDGMFKIFVTSQSITKLEPQYLLANTLFAAGTALQTFLTKWDSTEWSGVTNTYYFQAEGANGGFSDPQLWEADGGGSALASLTDIDNAQISSAVTMPTSQDLDVKADPTNQSLAAARILVTVVKTVIAQVARSFGMINGA